jgi:hypothetical protein
MLGLGDDSFDFDFVEGRCGFAADRRDHHAYRMPRLSRGQLGDA